MRGFGWESKVVIIVMTLAAIGNLIGIHAFCSDSALKAYAAGEASSCWEFWLNRYQTLIGAVVAVIAAASAWAGLQASLDVSRKQLAASAVEHLDRRRTMLYKLRDLLIQSEFTIRQPMYERLCRIYPEMVKNLSNLDDLYRSVALANLKAETNNIHYELQNHSNNLLLNMRQLKTELEVMTLSEKCRRAVCQQHTRINSMNGLTSFVSDALNAIEKCLEMNLNPEDSLAEFKWSCNKAVERMSERVHGECEKIIDEELTTVNTLIDQALSQIEVS